MSSLPALRGNSMHIIGLTGGIASGKSTVSAMLAQLGAYIVDADQIAHEIVEPGQPAWQEIVTHFSKNILLPDGRIDRKSLGELIFNNISERTWLEKITHYRVRERTEQMLVEAQQQGCTVAVLDVPLLLEVGWQDMADEIWVVYVDEATQLSRLISRSNLLPEQAAARIKAQMSLTEKINYADVIIDNNKDVENTRLQVIAAWEKIIGSS